MSSVKSIGSDNITTNHRQHIITVRLTGKSPSHVRMYTTFDRNEDNPNKKGYWLHIQPYTVERCDGYTIERMTGYSGIKAFVQPATRFNSKTLNDIAKDDLYNFNFLSDFLNHNGLKIADDYLENHPNLQKVIE